MWSCVLLTDAAAEATDVSGVGIVPVGSGRDLIAALDDGDPVIRSWAIRGLEEMTGQTLGYEPFASQALRDEAVARWVRWQRGGGDADTVIEAGAEPEAPDGSPG